MYKQVFALFFILCILGAQCAPLQETEEIPEEEHVRVKRFTCDVLSFNISILGNGGQLNHAACALHCLKLGKKGGHCNGDAVCVCRK